MLVVLQYIHYKTSLPDLKEFTVCLWHKFYNHSNDHPLFSYAGTYSHDRILKSAFLSAATGRYRYMILQRNAYLTVVGPRMFNRVGRLQYRAFLSFLRTRLHRTDSTYPPVHLATAAVIGERDKTDTHTLYI